ncbi:Eco57I restriction-modification methylase domain-containing protein [Methanothermococcus sp. SCGC AD-155-C09]|nr:Eco57I restriction-modification methylase domain-containing protein [Methanothermococcus sp. SCGC AD-155-C09]
MELDIGNIIKKELKRYKKKELKISDKKYTLYVVPDLCDEDINIHEGFLFVDEGNKKESLYFKTKYRAPVDGYAPRLAFIIYKDDDNNYLLIKDYRRNKHIIKTLRKINSTFLKKLKNTIKNPTEENLRKLFDRTDVIGEFYILYRKSREYLLKNIKGISEEEKREEFVDNFMMQMLTLWYLQEREFFNKDKNYFITKFRDMYQKKLSNVFNNYYEFLNYLFEKISGYENTRYYEDEHTGKVVVIGPAVFLNGKCNEAITIPDECFYKEGITDTLIDTRPNKVGDEVPLFNLFESRDWTEGNIDEFVLGAIYEKLINHIDRKKLGAYYTPEEITSYICKNTIESYLVDKINEKFNKEFKNIDHIIDDSNKEIILHLFKELKEIKILDPAVGSAHFLESAINTLLGIYKKIWRKAKGRDKKKKIKIKELNITTTDEKGNIEKINLITIKNEDEFQLLVKFFIILSKNIYGVDINPSAIKVAKARLFLTLAKHFNVGKEKDLSIRFPNVHFNLRVGNSLIGYVDLKKEEGGNQVKLDMFMGEVDHITDKINVVKELKPYLEKIAKSLDMEGDILKEIEELNKILSKNEIKWEDFKRILEVKEKLITILIASLNSKYAIPLNELLRDITEIFNQKLDEKFSEEYKINLEDLKKVKTFHWIFEFPEVFLERRGFDVVIGNPPYGRIKQIIKDKNEKYLLSKIYSNLYKCQVGNLNLYKLFLERSYYILKNRGYFSMIFPSSFLGENDSKKLRKLFFDKGRVIKILEFPEKTYIFEGNTQAVCILFYNKNKQEDYEIAIKTNISKDEKNNLLSIKFLNIRKSELRELTGEYYRIPLFHEPKIEWQILKHISKFSPFKGDEKNPSIGEIGEGHLHETLDKEFMSYEPADDLLIKGIHLGRYFVNLDPNGPTPRWIKDKEKFFKKKPEAEKIVKLDKIIGRNTINKASKPRLRFAPLKAGYVITNSIKYILKKDKNINEYYIIVLLNSTMLNWRFELFSLQNNIRNYEIESLPMPRIPLSKQQPFITLADYLLFLNATEERREKLKEAIEFFNDQIADSLVYELYFKEKFSEDGLYPEPKEYLLETISKLIKPINYDRWGELYWKKQLEGNITKDEERELKKLEEENLKTIEEVYTSIKNNSEVKKWIEKIKSHEWIKVIEDKTE